MKHRPVDLYSANAGQVNKLGCLLSDYSPQPCWESGCRMRLLVMTGGKPFGAKDAASTNNLYVFSVICYNPRMVNIEPTGEHAVPYSLDTEEAKNFHDTVVVAANTADLLEELGASIEIEKDDIDKTLELFKASNRHVAKHALKQPSTASAASLFLRSYANQVATDAAEIRSAVTSKLMEIANCGDPRYELKALELLGKHSDVGLFTERSEITINHKTSSDLEEAIKERVKRLLNANIVDVTPIADNLDDELGVIEDEPRALLDEINEGDDESADIK